MKPERPDGCGLCLMLFAGMACSGYLIYNLYGNSWAWSPFVIMVYLLCWGIFLLKRNDKLKKQKKDYNDYHDRRDRHW